MRYLEKEMFIVISQEGSEKKRKMDLYDIPFPTHAPWRTVFIASASLSLIEDIMAECMN